MLSTAVPTASPVTGDTVWAYLVGPDGSVDYRIGIGVISSYGNGFFRSPYTNLDDGAFCVGPDGDFYLNYDVEISYGQFLSGHDNF